jgi:hypothetical protein
MSSHCVDVAFYWTPKEAAAIVDYLDRLRDTVWELYSDDIIGCRTKELEAQCDPRQQHPHFDDETDTCHDSQARPSTPCTRPGEPVRESTLMNEHTVPREALPALADLPSLSDENIGDMLNLLRTLLQACEEHYKEPIRRLEKQRHRELLPEGGQDLPISPTMGWDEDF